MIHEKEPMFVNSADEEDEDEEDMYEDYVISSRRRMSGGRGLSLRGGPRTRRIRRNRKKNRRKYGYVCRGRIGRGGRYILDRVRVPVPKRRKIWHHKREDRNRPNLDDPSVKMMLERTRTVYARPPHRVVMITPASTLAQFVDPRPAHEMDNQNDFDRDEAKRRQNLNSIYAMSDSEDERVVPQNATFGVEATIPSDKRVKFVLEV